MKNVLSVVFILICYSFTFGQPQSLGEKGGFGNIGIPSYRTTPADTVKGWTNSLAAKLNLSQVGFSNWKSGGENSFNWVSTIDGKFIYRQSDIDWRTQTKFSYGQTKQGKSKFKKSDDVIDVSSVASYILGFKVDPYFSVTMRSQFDKGYNYIGDSAVQVSGFFDPGYITQNIGFQYLYGTIFDVRMGFSLKETYSKKFTNYTDDIKTSEIEKIKVQPGAELVSNYTNKFGDNVALKSKFELFTNFKRFDEIDLRWDTYLSYTLIKYIELSLNYVMYYNKDESSQFQWKEIVAVGLAFDIL